MSNTETLKPCSMWSEDDEGVVGYMCLIDYECELGMAAGGNAVFGSIEDLKNHHLCWEGCGIAKVKVVGIETVVPSNFPPKNTRSGEKV